MAPKFLRSDTVRHLRLGKKRRNLQKWRRPRGRHSKIRKGRVGYPAAPSIGYKQNKTHSGKIKGKYVAYVENLNDLNAVPKDAIVVLSRRIGARKKIDIIKKATEMKISILNMEKQK